MMRFPVTLLFVGLLFWPRAAQAVPITWTVSGTFLDGGTATGSFVFDADTSVYSLINITTTAGSTVLTGTTYAYEHPLYAGGLNALVLLDTAVAAAGTRLLQLPFSTPLTNAGGTVALGGLLLFGEGTCASTPCQSVSANLPHRSFASGQLTGTAVPTESVPEPSSLLLVGAGVALAAMRRRR